MVAQIMLGVYLFAPDAPPAEPEPAPQAPEPAVMLADIDNLEPADMLAELLY